MKKSSDGHVKTQFSGLSAFDVICKEFHYHRSCQRNLSRKIKTTTVNDDVAKRNQCFEDITNYVHEAIIMEGNVIRMDDLTKMYETIQSQKCLEIKGAVTQLLKARLINRFGNEIFAERESQHINMQSYLPNNIQPSTFVTFIYDNCDHNPESITGVSMHCTNGIIVQHQSPESEVLTTNSTAIVTSNRRSFKPVTHELAPYYQSRDKVTLSTIENIEMNENMLGDMSKVSNFVWLMS